MIISLKLTYNIYDNWKTTSIFAARFYPQKLQRWRQTTFAKATAVETGCSAARLAHLVWDQRVAGSNPATPTKEKALHASAGLCFSGALKTCFHKHKEKQSP